MSRGGANSKEARALVCALCVLGAARAASGGVAIESEGVRVEFGAAEDARAKGLPGVVSRARRELAESLGLGLPARIAVRLLRTKEAFVGYSGGRPVELYAGKAYPGSGVILVNMNALEREARVVALPRTVRHELVHLAVGHTLGRGRLPTWFEEGLACAFGSPIPSARSEVARAAWAIPLRELATFPRDRRRLSLAYAQSECVVRFLGTRAVRDILRRVASGESFEKALKAASGHTTHSLDAAWRKSRETGWALWFAREALSPSRVLLWAALLAVVAYFIITRRRRRQAETMGD